MELSCSHQIDWENGVEYFGRVQTNCYLLDDDRKVLAFSKTAQVLGLSGKSEQIHQAVGSIALKQFISQDLLDTLTSPIRFSILHNREVVRLNVMVVTIPLLMGGYSRY